MTNAHINKLGMYLAVIQVLNKFSAVFANVPALVRLAASLAQLAANIGTKSEAIGIGTSPKTEAKRKAEGEMSAGVSVLVGKLHSYATDKENAELMKQSDVTEWDIHHQRDAERGKYADQMLDLVEANLPNLADYAVTSDKIAAARQLVVDHDGTIGDRSSTKNSQTGGRDSVMAMFAQADSILEDQIDRMIPDFKKDNPDFCAAYDAARVIKDIAAHHKGKNNGGNTGSSSPKPPDSK